MDISNHTSVTEVSNRTDKKTPDIQYNEIKDSALGKNYTLSVVFVSATESNRINKEYRKKDKPTNILSFPYSHDSGEIVFCLEVIEAEAKHHELPIDQYLIYLFIHGLIHLSGFDHSLEMEKRELAQRKKFLPADFVRP